jgi:formylglycine-generating enzyme required for sulfatase activity
VSNIAPVGTATLGAGSWGQLDLAGNVFEWNLDWGATYVDPCTDCADFTATSDRVYRGGDFAITTPSLLPQTHGGVAPTYRSGGAGFRCARSP